MKQKNLLVFCTFALTVTLAAWVVVDITKKHSQGGTGHSLSFSSHKAATETTNDTSTHDATSHDASTQSEVSTVPQVDTNATNTSALNDEKKEDSTSAEEFKDIEFIQYTVKENDTVWKIATTFMPDYNAHPKDGKEGVIAYIVKENKLEKLSDDNYHIFTGQKLTIPKQKDIAINTSTKNSSSVKTTTVAKKTDTSKSTTKSTASTTQKTSSNNSVGNSDVTTSATDSTNTNHTDHSNH